MTYGPRRVPCLRLNCHPGWGEFPPLDVLSWSQFNPCPTPHFLTPVYFSLVQPVDDGLLPSSPGRDSDLVSAPPSLTPTRHSSSSTLRTSAARRLVPVEPRPTFVPQSDRIVRDTSLRPASEPLSLFSDLNKTSLHPPRLLSLSSRTLLLQGRLDPQPNTLNPRTRPVQLCRRSVPR